MNQRAYELDKYQLELLAYLKRYASNANMSLQNALRDVLGDLRYVAKDQNLDYFKAIEDFDKE